MNRPLVSAFLFALSLSAPALADEFCSELQGGIDLKTSPNDDRRQFCKFAKDTVAGGCCQSSLYDCLKSKRTCARGQTLGVIGLGVIATGATEEKAVAAATAYEDSFAPDKRSVMDTSKVPCRGPKGGMTLAEFSDFDCPHCAAAVTEMHQLQDTEKDLQLCSFAFPLPGHRFSALAAAAAMYADSQGKYWPMAERLFSTQDEREGLEEEPYKNQVLKVASAVGLDKNAVKAAMEPKSPFMEKVRDQQMLAIGLLIQGTPSFFIDGRSLSGIPNIQLDAAVRDERDSKGKK